MSIKRLCKYFTIIISVVCLMCFSIVGHAETENYSIRIQFTVESKPASGSSFKIYYAMNTSGELSGGFANLNVETGDLSDSKNVNRLASTLAAYTMTGVAKPVSVAKTDGLGCATFAGLSDGIYLVTGTSVIIDNVVYTPKPTLIDFKNATGSTVTAGIKYAITADASDVNTPISRTVKKIWDDGNSSSRPESVTVQLYQNETLYDEEILSAENNWEYTWDSLNPRYDWNVVETSVPDGYTVSLTLDDKIFTVENKGQSIGTFVTNTGTSTPTTAYVSGADTSTATVDTAVTGTETTDTAITGNGTSSSTVLTNATNPKNSSPKSNVTTYRNPYIPTPTNNNTNQSKLPQTGQLWYPVPILFVLGLILFFIGIAFGDENEKG